MLTTHCYHDNCTLYTRHICQGKEVLTKYVALHAAQLLQDGQAVQALGVFTQYGVSDNPANFNLYRYSTYTGTLCS